MLRNLLERFGLGRLAYNTVLGTLWQFTRIGTQALWLVAIAHCLGPGGYGALAGLAGLAVTMSGFSGLGSGPLLLKEVSREPGKLSAQWRKAVVTTVASGLALTVIYGVAACWLNTTMASWSTLVAIGVSELICFPLVNAAAAAFQAHEHLPLATMMPAGMSALRLVAVAVFWASGLPHHLSAYVWFHFGASMLAALFALALVHAILRPGKCRYRIDHPEIREGLGFSLTWFTNNALGEFDKTLTLRLADSHVAGIYAAIYRLANILTAPAIALIGAAQPRLFRQARDHEGNWRSGLAYRLFVFAGGYGIVASLTLPLLSHALPVLLGPDFAQTAQAAGWLMLVPLAYSLRQAGSTILMTSGHQAVRIAIEVCGIALMIGLFAALVPGHGLPGSAIAMTATEVVLASSMWIALLKQKTGIASANGEGASRKTG
ncbi:MAG: lipopolysaccharide biosynthesis protein [Solimonas sp.]